MANVDLADARGHKNALVINRGAAIVGSLTLEGHIQIDGAVDGEVRCKALRIGERGLVEGLIVAEKVVILGEFAGEIYADEIVLGAACAVDGTICHNKLILERGCYFEGKSRRYADPLAHAPATSVHFVIEPDEDDEPLQAWA